MRPGRPPRPRQATATRLPPRTKQLATLGSRRPFSTHNLPRWCGWRRGSTESRALGDLTMNSYLGPGGRSGPGRELLQRRVPLGISPVHGICAPGSPFTSFQTLRAEHRLVLLLAITLLPSPLNFKCLQKLRDCRSGETLRSHFPAAAIILAQINSYKNALRVWKFLPWTPAILPPQDSHRSRGQEARVNTASPSQSPGPAPSRKVQ